MPDSTTLPDEHLRRVRRLYETGGQLFLVLPNQSRYPLACFFDTVYHLNEGCQQIHSRAVAAELANQLVRVRAPEAALSTP